MKTFKSLMTWLFLVVFGFVVAELALLGANCFVYYKIYTLNGWTWQAAPYAVLAFCLILIPAGLQISSWIIDLSKSLKKEEAKSDILDEPKTDFLKEKGAHNG